MSIDRGAYERLSDEDLNQAAMALPKAELVRFLAEAMRQAGFPDRDVALLPGHRKYYLAELFAMEIRDPWPKVQGKGARRTVRS